MKKGVRLRSTLLALFIYPGAGQLSNGQPWKAAAFAVPFTLCSGVGFGKAFAVLNSIYTSLTLLGTPPDLTADAKRIILFMALGTLIWLVALVDAVRCAPQEEPTPEPG